MIVNSYVKYDGSFMKESYWFDLPFCFLFFVLLEQVKWCWFHFKDLLIDDIQCKWMGWVGMGWDGFDRHGK